MKAYPGAIWETAPVNAAWNPMMVSGSNMPGFDTYDRELGVPPLMKSHREAALIGEAYVAPYMGTLPAGIVVNRITDGPKAGYVVPVDFAVTCESTSSSTITVAAEDAKYFAVGDVLKEFGAITDIAAPSGGKVVITGTSSPSGATTEVKFATEANPLIIDQAVMSLESGAMTSVIYNNAVIYRARLKNVTDENITAAGWYNDGQFTIVK